MFNEVLAHRTAATHEVHVCMHLWVWLHRSSRNQIKKRFSRMMVQDLNRSEYLWSMRLMKHIDPSRGSRFLLGIITWSASCSNPRSTFWGVAEKFTKKSPLSRITRLERDQREFSRQTAPLQLNAHEIQSCHWKSLTTTPLGSLIARPLVLIV